MTALTEYFDREAAISQSIRSAVVYPAVMLCMMLLIVGVLLTNVMPVFHQVFLQLGTEMTGLSRVLMNLGLMIRRYGAVLGCLAAALVALGLWFAMTTRGRRAFSFAFTFPPPGGCLRCWVLPDLPGECTWPSAADWIRSMLWSW